VSRSPRVLPANRAAERHNRRVTSDVKPLVAAYWQAYNAGNWDAVREMVADDYVHHSGDAESHDVEFFVSGARGLRAAFPDVRVEVRDMVAEDDRVAVRWVARATHTGSLFGEEATGRPVAIDGATIHRVVDGRIAEDWEVMNEGALRDQLAAETMAAL
jgi:steroid delta-isomerase-like uncharacterized protein